DVEILTVGPFQSNCYILRGERVLVIDPGAEAERILARLGADDADADAADADGAASLRTHARVDHVGAVAAVARAAGTPVRMHPAGRFLYDAAAEHARMFGLEIESPPPPDVELDDGQRLSFDGLAGLEFEVRHTPGHSPGHVTF